VRTLARFLASEGRTVFLSSHLMSEMAQTADHLIVLGRGKVLADSPVADVISQASGDAVRVRSPHADHLVSLLRGPDVAVTAVEPGVVELRGVTAERVGDVAASSGVVLHELTPLVRSLEDAYMTLTQDSVEYHAGGAAAGSHVAPDAQTPQGATR
jgi:ABC-2 type transport system ATP-binding protein